MTQSRAVDVFFSCVKQHGPRPAMRYKSQGVWHTITWSEYAEQVKCVAKGMISLGVEPRDGVVIIGGNRPEWVIADVAAIFCGAIPAGIYTTNSAEQCRYITDHCDATMAVVENAVQLEKFQSIRAQLPKLKHIVVMDAGDATGDAMTFDALIDAGENITDAALDARMNAQVPSDVCALIYTSGTTGNPKAVMITHEGVSFVAESLQTLMTLEPSDRLISYLPMSHIAEQAVTIYGPMTVGASVSFAESVEKLGDNLREIRPTIFLGVPRVWEKIQSKMQAAASQITGVKKRLATWAKAQGKAARYRVERGMSPGWRYKLADKLVFSKVRAKLGLDACRMQATAAAPIAMSTLEYFANLGIPICEVYGMSECTGPGTVSLPFNFRLGKCGQVVPGTELRIAEDGEILMRGKHVFKGYLKDPEATRETLDADGWLHSGDLGKLDEEGFLQITGRKKELIITAGGENISPSMIEGLFQSVTGIGHAMVVGDRKKYLTVLLSLDPEKLAILAEQAGSSATILAQAAVCPKINAFIDEQIKVLNKQLARVQTIKAFRIAPGEFSIDGGELTATMKLKRNVVLAKYDAMIASMYNDDV